MRASWIRRLTSGETVMSRLVQRLALAPQADQPEETLLQLSPVAVTTLNLDDVLRDGLAQTTTADLSGAAGTYAVLWTVPSTERWYAQYLSQSGTVANSSITIYRGAIGVMLVTLSTAAKGIAMNRMRLEPGDVIEAYKTGNAGDNSVGHNIFYERELIGG